MHLILIMVGLFIIDTNLSENLSTLIQKLIYSFTLFKEETSYSFQ